MENNIHYDLFYYIIITTQKKENHTLELMWREREDKKKIEKKIIICKKKKKKIYSGQINRTFLFFSFHFYTFRIIVNDKTNLDYYYYY